MTTLGEADVEQAALEWLPPEQGWSGKEIQKPSISISAR